MIIKLKDKDPGSELFVPLMFKDGEEIFGYLKDDAFRATFTVRWSDVEGFLGSYNFAEDGDFEFVRTDGMRIIPLQCGRPFDSQNDAPEPSDMIYGYRADIVEQDLMGKRMIERFPVEQVSHITGHYQFSPIISDIFVN